MTTDTFWAKLVASALAAFGMYWMRIPHQVVWLMLAQASDLWMGVIVAIGIGGWAAFSVRKLGQGIMFKAAAYPLLAICDLVEEPLHLAFHLDAYVALALIAYEFLSVVESYAKIRPLPKIVQVVAEKAQEYLSTSIPETVHRESVVKRIEIEPSFDSPNPPATIVTTTTRETQTVTKQD